MKPILIMLKGYTIIVFLIFSSIISGQTIKAVHLADNLLKTGNFKAAVTTYDFPRDIKELQDKSVKNLKSSLQCEMEKF